MTETALRPRHEAAPVSAEVVAVTDTFVGLMRSFNRARARMLATAAHDVEWSAHVLLRCVAHDGPMRASAVAECLHSDPSTVSRQVAALVKSGLLERRADPIDGRASLLVTTAKAGEVLAEHDEIKMRHFARMLADWDEPELRLFSELLARFTRDFERANGQFEPAGFVTASTEQARSTAQLGRNG